MTVPVASFAGAPAGDGEVEADGMRFEGRQLDTADSHAWDFMSESRSSGHPDGPQL